MFPCTENVCAMRRILTTLKKLIIVINIYEASLHARLWATNYLLRFHYVLDTILNSIDRVLNKIATVNMFKEFTCMFYFGYMTISFGEGNLKIFTEGLKSFLKF